MNLQLKKVLITILFTVVYLSTNASNIEYVTLADSRSVTFNTDSIGELVKDTASDVKLLGPLYEKVKNKTATDVEKRFLLSYRYLFSLYYKRLYKEGVSKRSVDILNTVRRQSRTLVSFSIDTYGRCEIRSLRLLPERCDKRLSLINSANANQTSQTQADDQTENLKLIIKEQREQIEYLKKRLEECESNK